MAHFSINIAGEVDDFRSLVSGSTEIAGKRMVVDRSLLSGGSGVIKTISGDVTVSGIPEVIANWNRVSKGIQQACYEQLIEAAALIEIQSSIEVPFLTGQLQGCLKRDEVEIGAAERAENETAPVRVYIYYDVSAISGVGGEDGETYAWKQHEKLDYDHPTPGTKAKYLEDPFKEVAELFPELCASAVSKALPGLGAGSGGPRLVKKK